MNPLAASATGIWIGRVDSRIFTSLTARDVFALPRESPHPVPLPQGRAIAFDVVAMAQKDFLHAEPRRTRSFEALVGATGRSPVSLSYGGWSPQSGSSTHGRPAGRPYTNLRYLRGSA